MFKVNHHHAKTKVVFRIKPNIYDELFVKIVPAFQPLTVFATHSILDDWLGSEYVSEKVKKKDVTSVLLVLYNFWIQVSKIRTVSLRFYSILKIKHDYQRNLTLLNAVFTLPGSSDSERGSPSTSALYSSYVVRTSTMNCLS